MRRILSYAIAVELAGGSASHSGAQTFELFWNSIDSGGALSTGGGPFDLSGSIGQIDTGWMIGGGFQLSGGFWAGAETSCFGDLNGDRIVDIADLSLLLSHFGQASGATAGDGDLNGDRDVDLEDLSGLLSAFATSCM